MASIKGVALKGIKSFTGNEGYGMEASIYLDGKKVGRYFDAADGGMATVDIDDSAIEKELQTRSEVFFLQYPHEYADLELFLVILGDFTELEKLFKRSVKADYNVLVAEGFCEGGSGRCVQVRCSVPVNVAALIAKYSADIKNPRVFESLDDFNIE